MTTEKTLKIQVHLQKKKLKANFKLYKNGQKKGKRFMTITGFFWSVLRTSINNDRISDNYRFITIFALIIQPQNQLYNIFKMSFHDFDKDQIQNALPNYKYIKCVGEGAYGKVYLMEKIDTSQMYAVKRISCFGMNQYQLAGALNQVRILASLDHPNIVKFYDGLFDKEHDQLYIFLQYANGGDVAQLIEQAKQKKKRISQNTVWRILLNVAEAVQYLHKHDIAHRDIKPANIFRDKQSGFKLGDLNVSKILPKGSMTKTRAGSPFYISPQVWNHQDEGYGSKCDIWSLGVVIYELCCLRVPFQVQSPQQMLQKLKISKKKSLPKYYSADLHELVDKMLEIDPLKRVSPDYIICLCRKNLKINTEKKIDDTILLKTIVVPQTNERWVNLVHLARRDTVGRSISLRKSIDSYEKKSDVVIERGLSNKKNYLMVPPQMIKRASKTSKGSRQKSKSNKGNQLRLPSLRKNSAQIDISNLSCLVQKKSDDHSKNSQNEISFRGSRIKRNIVCEYIKEVREDLANFEVC